MDVHACFIKKLGYYFTSLNQDICMKQNIILEFTNVTDLPAKSDFTSFS